MIVRTDALQLARDVARVLPHARAQTLGQQHGAEQCLEACVAALPQHLNQTYSTDAVDTDMLLGSAPCNNREHAAANPRDECVNKIAGCNAGKVRVSDT